MPSKASTLEIEIEFFNYVFMAVIAVRLTTFMLFFSSIDEGFNYELERSHYVRIAFRMFMLIALFDPPNLSSHCFVAVVVPFTRSQHFSVEIR